MTVPKGDNQTVRYDDGTSDELEVPLGTTAFVSGVTMFEILPPELKSLAVRSKVRYAPHPYVWMAPARALSTGLGIISDGLEMPLDELPEWEESKIKTYPVVRPPSMTSYLLSTSLICAFCSQCWLNPVTKKLHFQVHPCGIQELFVDPLPEGASRDDAIYPDGAHITDLKEVRDTLYKMQRPAIDPKVWFIIFCTNCLLIAQHSM